MFCRRILDPGTELFVCFLFLLSNMMQNDMKFYHFKLQCRVCSYILQQFLISFYQLTFQIHGLREWKLCEYLDRIIYYILKKVKI